MKKPKKGVTRIVEVLGVLIGLLVIALLIYGFLNIDTIGNEVDEKIYSYGLPGLFIVSALLDLIPQFISPVIVLGSAIIIGINFKFAIIAVVLGSAAGSIIGFWLGKHYLLDIVNMLVSKKKSDRMEELMNKYGKIIVSVAAISPLPYLPVVLGALRMSNKNFLIYGLIPRALSIIVIGYLTALF